MQFTGLAAAVFAVFLPLEAAAEAVPPGPTGACYTVWVSSPNPTGKASARRRSSPTFSARDVLDLEFLVILRPTRPPTEKKIELKLFTPRGHLYQTLSVSSKATGFAPAPGRRSRYQTASLSLPVAGTTIVNNSLYGTWRAEAYVQGESSPCAKPKSFEIQP